VLRRDGGHELLANLPDVLRFGAAVGQDWHLLISLGGGLQPERTLFVAGHVSIAGIRESNTRVVLRTQDPSEMLGANASHKSANFLNLPHDHCQALEIFLLVALLAVGCMKFLEATSCGTGKAR